MAKALDAIKTDFYQTDEAVIVTLLVKNVKEEYLTVDVQDRKLTVNLKFPDVEEKVLQFNLLRAIIPESSTYKIMSTKVEIKLQKLEGYRWEKLEGALHENYAKPISSAPPLLFDKPPSYPTSKGTDWSAIEKEIIEEELKEKPQGEDGLNQLFQKIYGEGNDEVKKAMNKSFMESGGTVLSTNWKEISEKKVEIKPPDGMEYKKWDS